MSNKSTLKRAIDAIKPHEALRIPLLKNLEAPVFTAPVRSIQPEVKSTLGKKPPEVNSTQGVKLPQAESTRGVNHPEVFSTSGNNPPKMHSNLRSKDTLGEFDLSEGQKSAIQFANDFTPKLASGFTRLPNSILLKIVGGDLSKSEIKILLLIARLTISFKRHTVPLSRAVIERMTKVQGNVAAQSLRALEQQGFIRRIQGDPRRPTEIGLIFNAADSCMPDLGQAPEFERQEPCSRTSGEIPPEVKNDLRSIQSPGAFLPDFKDSKNNINTLSQIDKYFDDLKPLRKRESEAKAFQELKNDFPEQDIADCLERVLAQGLPGGEPCHSPMAYLATAMADVLRIVTEDREQKRKKAEREAQAEAQKQREHEEIEHENREWEKREQAFCRVFSDQDRQEEIIRELCQKNNFPINKGKAARTYVVGFWWNNLNDHERKEASA